MKHGFKYLGVVMALLLAGCGAGDPPSAPGGMDLGRVWSGTL